MKLDEIWEHSRYEYTQLCNCGIKHEILTQYYDSPEYETDIYVLCKCGEYIHFVLPVN